MKVGILTMHRVLNHGSFMQGYALKRTIENMGHEVEFRDFKPGIARHLGSKVKMPGMLKKIAKIPDKLIKIWVTRCRSAVSGSKWITASGISACLLWVCLCNPTTAYKPMP